MRVNAAQIELQGLAGLLSTTTGVGDAGDLVVNAETIAIRDGAGITVSSRGLAERAGNLEITADTLQLENKGDIEARTNAGDGGNINLQVEELLLLRRESNISTTAGTDEAGGNGGNIEIDTTFLDRLESSNVLEFRVPVR